MTTSGIPDQRRATAAVLTAMGWLQGTFHLPPMQTWFDFLAGGSPVLKLTRVRLPVNAPTVPFLALRRESLHLLAPTIDELIELPGAQGHTTPRQVEILLSGGWLRGRIEVLVNLRVSDFLRQQTGLAVVREAVFSPHGSSDPAHARKLPVVLVNLAEVVGIAQTGEHTR
jgi:hypothetical protein